MVNIKDKVYKALCDEFGEDHVSDQYPKDWSNLPAVQYTEEDNRVSERTNEGETKSYVRYRVDIWDAKSTSDYSLMVEDALGIPLEKIHMETAFGLSRTSCHDVPDPSGLKHKEMRYEGIIDNENEGYIYWNNSTL